MRRWQTGYHGSSMPPQAPNAGFGFTPVEMPANVIQIESNELFVICGTEDGSFIIFTDSPSNVIPTVDAREILITAQSDGVIMSLCADMTVIRYESDDVVPICRGTSRCIMTWLRTLHQPPAAAWLP